MQQVEAAVELARPAAPKPNANEGHRGCPVAGVTRPIAVADLRGGDAGQPAIVQASLADLADGEAATLFASPVWLKACGYDEQLLVVGTPQSGAGLRLLFAQRNRHLLHLGRLLWFEPEAIAYLSTMLFNANGASFVVFEDLQVGGRLSSRMKTTVFRYHRNWQIVLNGPDADAYRITKDNPSGMRRNIRRKQKALERDLGPIDIGVEERPSRDLLKAIVDMNRLKIESTNRKFGIDGPAFERLWAVVSEVGHIVTLKQGSRLIAGDVICILDGRAYHMESGYDMTAGRYSPGAIVHSYSIDDCRRRGLFDFNMLWGDGAYKQHVGARPRELQTVVVGHSPATRFSPADLRAVRHFRWLDFKRRVKPLVYPLLARLGGRS